MPFPHLAAIGRKNKIYTQIQFPERPWRNENLFGFQEYHLCPDPRHFLIDSGANVLISGPRCLRDQWPAPVISPGWPGLGDHGDVYPGGGQTNTARPQSFNIKHFLIGDSFTSSETHIFWLSWTIHHSKGIGQHVTLCLTLRMLTLVTLGLTMGPGGVATLPGWRDRDNGIISVMRRHRIIGAGDLSGMRQERVITKSTLTITIHSGSSKCLSWLKIQSKTTILPFMSSPLDWESWCFLASLLLTWLCSNA